MAKKNSAGFFLHKYHESFHHYWKLITEINALTGDNYRQLDQSLWPLYQPFYHKAILSGLHMIGLQSTCSRFPVESTELRGSLFIYRWSHSLWAVKCVNNYRSMVITGLWWLMFSEYLSYTTTAWPRQTVPTINITPSI